MIWHKNAKRLTAAEVEHLERVRELGCCACSHFGLIYFAPIHIHHIVEHNQRLGHMWILPLCPAHHVGSPFTLYQTLLIPREARVSIASGSRAFARVYGSERELWVRVQAKLGLPAEWPESTKILPRRLHA